jgi:lipopolysaccharide export system permease protein
MNRLARYVLISYLEPLLASVGGLMVLVLMGDLMDRVNKFIAGRTSFRLVAEYLWSLLPMRLTEILPMSGLLAALLSLGAMSHRKEIVAAMGGGVHPWRFVRPIVWMGVLMSLLSLGLGEYVTPAAARKAGRIWREDVRHVVDRRPERFDNVTAAGRDGVFYSLGTLDTGRGAAEDVMIERTRGGRPYDQIQAARGEWTADGWTLRGGVERTFDDEGRTLVSQKPFAERKLLTAETPADLAPAEEDTDGLGYEGLNRRIRKLRILGVPTRRLEVDLYTKLALPWANLIVLLIGIPLAFQKSGGKVKAVAFALGVAFVYFGFLQVGRALGQKAWCPPWLGAWMANILFLAAGGFMFLRMRKTS